ncbi:ComF family protein [bacterium]|nr:ComF family protein [bacterium]
MTEANRLAQVYRAHHLLWQMVDWVYPPRCAACGKWGERWCNACQQKVKVITTTDLCPLCGIPQAQAELCAECTTYLPVYTALRSWGTYEGTLRTAIHRLKYHSDIGLSEDLAKPLIGLLRDLSWQIDMITAVPLSGKRKRERGYNQAALLARWIGLSEGLPFHPNMIRRSRDTSSQVGLHAHQRRQNVAGAFNATSAQAVGKSILVIDDVATTGATMQACALALSNAGASRIYGLTLARAGHIHLS